MNPNKYTVLLLLLITLTGCKKNRLVDERAILEGTWIWVETLANDPTSGLIVLSSSNPNFPEHTLVLEKKGRFKLSKEGDEIADAKMKFESSNETPTTAKPDLDIEFIVTLKEKHEDDQSVSFWFNTNSTDTMYSLNTPFNIYGTLSGYGDASIRWNKYVKSN